MRARRHRGAGVGTYDVHAQHRLQVVRGPARAARGDPHRRHRGPRAQLEAGGAQTARLRRQVERAERARHVQQHVHAARARARHLPRRLLCAVRPAEQQQQAPQPAAGVPGCAHLDAPFAGQVQLHQRQPGAAVLRLQRQELRRGRRRARAGHHARGGLARQQLRRAGSPSSGVFAGEGAERHSVAGGSAGRPAWRTPAQCRATRRSRRTRRPSRCCWTCCAPRSSRCALLQAPAAAPSEVRASRIG